MNENYKKIFWGLILLLLNINLTFNTFNLSVIPSFISFIIIYNGLKGLAEDVAGEGKYFLKGAIISKIMIVVTLVRWLVDAFTAVDSSYIMGNSNITVVVVAFLIEVVTLVMIYYILKGIYLEYENKSLSVHMKKVENVWNFYFTVSLITYVIKPFVINGNENAILMMSCMGIIYTIAYFALVFEVNEAGKELNKISL